MAKTRRRIQRSKRYRLDGFPETTDRFIMIYYLNPGKDNGRV